MTSYVKTKSAVKEVMVRGERLDSLVLATMEKISAIVGSTLGPGGAPVLIERQEFGTGPICTKDGVTCMQNLGFDDAISHSVYEAARDAAVKTVGVAGDGTTTATVLSYALVREAQAYRRAHPDCPPQRISEHLRNVFESKLLPRINKLSREVKFDDEGKKLLKSVAMVSGNGDEPLASAVLECLDIVGDSGNIVISEKSGPSGYQVEKLEGYPLSIGWEESTTRFSSVFVNDPSNGRCFLTKPYFILFNGNITDIQALYGLLDRMQRAWQNREGTEQHDPSQPFLTSPNIAIVACGFSEAVLGTLAMNWSEGSTINCLPVILPRSILANGETHLLEDLAAITGSTVLDPLNRPFDSATIPGEENLADVGQVDSFEMLRFRSTILGHADEDLIIERAEILQQMADTAISELDGRLIRERLAALSNGIARLWVVGSSTSELRERKDRCEDAVQAVRGALKSGCLPGGGWTLINLSAYLEDKYGKGTPEFDVLGMALREPVRLLLSNVGLNQEEVDTIIADMIQSPTKTSVFDCSKQKWVGAFVGGILDSTPAVSEAIKNSISIASLLGLLGGVIVFQRDHVLDRAEAQNTNSYLRDIGQENPANERA